MKTSNARLAVNSLLTGTSFDTLEGKTITFPTEETKLFHLQFRRFAGCPVCNTHLREFTRRADAIRDAGIQEVIFFHSSAEELRKHQADVPFALVADPDKRHYRRFGVEASAVGLLHPKVMWAALQSVLRGEVGLKMENGPLGLPADFLVEANGRVLATKYGTHAYDQWSVDELLELAKP